MIYALDTEFIEDGHTIALISVGVVCEDGRELYLQNQECHFQFGNDWVHRHVYPHLEDFDLARREPLRSPPTTDPHRAFNPTVWRTRSEIARAVSAFIQPEQPKPQIWGYYADYDWVVLNQLYGALIHHPEHWPFYCRDLRQWLDERELEGVVQSDIDASSHHALHDARWIMQTYQFYRKDVARRQ